MEYTIERELNAGERILWKGKPAMGLRLQPYDAFMIPFSLMWGGFAIFWEFMATGMTYKHSANTPTAVAIFFPLWGVPFVLIGLYMIFGRFFVDAKIRANTEYAVTNERAIIVSGLFARNVKSLNLKSVQDISIREKADGSGTITFNESLMPFGGRRNSLPGMGFNPIPAFTLIPEVRRVYNTLVKVQQGQVE